MSAQEDRSERTSVLLIEDDAVVGQDIKETLTSLGYHLAGWTAVGRDAVHLAEELQPDVVLMDVGLKGDMDGIQAATAIHERLSVPIVYMTGYRDENTLHRAVCSEPAGYLVKPFEEIELRCAIEVAVHRHRAETAMREREVTLQRTADLLESLSLVDELTGLKNRRAFYALAQQEIKAARRDGRMLALLFIDVNDLKPINDMHGHAAGDVVLRETAQVLAHSSRESDIVARLGGDEFVILARVADELSADTILQRLDENVESANARKENRFKLDLSVGMVIVDPSAEDEDITTLLAKADAYMYEEKRARRQRIAIDQEKGSGSALARLFTKVFKSLQKPEARKA